MVSVAEGLRECAAIVRDHGFKTKEWPGFATRGKGTLYPKLTLFHWTAGGSSNTASLNLVINGASRGLPNALCNTYSDREATLYLIAAEVAWHGGRGGYRGISGNSRLLGHEAENSGRGDWTPEHIAMLDVLAAAELEVFDLPLWALIDHYEYATPAGRKIDCRDIGGLHRRARVSTIDLRQPEPDPAPTEDVPMIFALHGNDAKPTGRYGTVNGDGRWYLLPVAYHRPQHGSDKSFMQMMEDAGVKPRPILPPQLRNLAPVGMVAMDDPKRKVHRRWEY